METVIVIVGYVSIGTLKVAITVSAQLKLY